MMIVNTSNPMDVKIDDDDLRSLCEIAVKAKTLTNNELHLVATICYHMIWDDLTEALKRIPIQN